jgi:hypothetical protein
VSVYFSASREHRNDLRRRQAVGDRLRHHGLDRVTAELARSADANPPTYLDVVRHISRVGGAS